MSYYVLRYGKTKGNGFYVHEHGVTIARSCAKKFSTRDGAEEAFKSCRGDRRIVRIVTAADRREQIARLKRKLDEVEARIEMSVSSREMSDAARFKAIAERDEARWLARRALPFIECLARAGDVLASCALNDIRPAIATWPAEDRETSTESRTPCPSSFTDRSDGHRTYECNGWAGHLGAHNDGESAEWTDALTWPAEDREAKET